MIENQLERRGKAAAAAMFDLHVLAGKDNWQMLLHVFHFLDEATDVMPPSLLWKKVIIACINAYL